MTEHSQRETKGQMQSMVRNWLIKSLIKSMTKMWTLVKFIEVIHSPLGIKHKTTTSSNALHMMAMKFFSYQKKTKVPQVKCVTSFPQKDAIPCVVLYYPCKNNITLLLQPISIYCLIENCSPFLNFVNWCEISFSLDAFKYFEIANKETLSLHLTINQIT
jgi:hypothetical protein